MQKMLRILLLFFISINVASAQDSLVVSRLLISEDADDLAPFIWNDKLVYTSERTSGVIGFDYTNVETESKPTSLFSAQRINDTTFTAPEILSKNLMSVHNDGPASFTRDGKFIYYARPHDIRASAADDNDNLHGIFRAEWDSAEWGNIKLMPFSNREYINTHPAISPNGDFIVFASAMPGGKGASDLVISRKVNGVWSDPVHLKNKINSKGRDNFPYIHANGDLYFSSDRKGDLDIYKCEVLGDSWSKPVALPAPINSKFDDFTFYLENSGSSGYFSSSRDGYFDLFYFHKPEEDKWKCDSLIDESFCYTFPKVKSEELEGMPLKFEWSINGEKPMPADQLVYCFPEAGRYSVKLNIVDTLYDKVIFIREVYEFLVERVEQPYIHVADEVKVNTIVDLDATGSYLPDIDPIEHEWDFGDGEGAKGIEVQHIYTNTGRFKISLTIYGSSIGGIMPHYCSFKYINVLDDAEEDLDVPYNQPLDLKAFVKMIEYEALPDDLYYLNLIGSSDNVMMINLFNSDKQIDLSDEMFSAFEDTTLLHVFKNDNESYSYYYGATFNLKDAYGHLVEARDAGFTDATIKNFKYTKLQSDEYFLSPMEDVYDQFAVVLKKTDEPIANYKDKFKKVPESLGEVSEVYVEGEGYYYVAGKSNELNNAYSAYTELKHEGFKSIRVKEFKEENTFADFSPISSSQEENMHMVELFKSPDYLEDDDPIFDLIGDRKIVSVRLDKKNVAYYVDGGSSLFEAKATLEEMKKKGFNDALISNFNYEKLADDGFYISSLVESDFTYMITFDSSESPLSMNDAKYRSLLGYKVYENYDPISKKYYYQVDAGKNLPNAVLLSKELSIDKGSFLKINKLRYEPLNDDEFFIDKLSEGDEQYVLVLGSFEEKQNIFETFKGFSSCSDIREFYDEETNRYVYVSGGYESLEDVFIALEECKIMGMEEVYIQKFVYDPLAPDQFFLKAVNEEEEVFRITLNRTSTDDSDEKSGNNQYDEIREEGVMLDAYDSESDEFVVALSGSKSLPIALDFLGDALKNGYNSAKVQRYIYSSLDQDRFVIRDLNKEDRYFCVELFHVDTLIPPDDPLVSEISRKYPISYSFNDLTNDYVYVIGPLENLEGGQEYLELAIADGFADARIMSMVYKSLKHDEFYITELDDIEIEFVITLLKTKDKVERDNVFFDGLPEGMEIEILLDSTTGYYNYVIRDLENIDNADSLYSIIQAAGYPFSRIEKLQYSHLNPDEFILETISESSIDFTVSLLRSKEKLGTDNPIFDEISKHSKVYEFYNYGTKEFIYTLDKVEGMVNGFEMLGLAKKYGFKEARIDQFIYSPLNPDHFTLEELSIDHSLFTIVLEESDTQLSDEYFSKIESEGYTVREKYIPGKNKWVYSIGLTDNIAEARMIAEHAKQNGFYKADVFQFNYMPLNADSYYLSEIEDEDVAYMLELFASDEKIDVNGERFNNVQGVYKVREVYDPVEEKYKYYAGDPIQDLGEANAFRDELIAMGYDKARISKFIYTPLRVDEHYLETLSDSDDISFVLEEKIEEREENKKDLQEEIDEQKESVVDSDKYDYEFFVYFGFDQYFLNSTALNDLKVFYNSYYNRDYEILVVGYTDSSGEADYNMWLSKKRAQSVKKYLLSIGVDESKITIVAKGESEIIYDSSRDEDARKSRRVMLRSKKNISDAVSSENNGKDVPSSAKDKYEYEFSVYFGFDQYFLSSIAISSLQNFYNDHYNRVYEIIVTGHTDSVGDEDYNLWLSRKRANSVKKYLLSMGVDVSNISIIAKGETEIVYDGSSKENANKSRRVIVRSTKRIE